MLVNSDYLHNNSNKHDATSNERKGRNNRLKLLMIGPLPPPLGGTTILFEQLVNDLRCSGCCDIEVIRSNCAETIRYSGVRRLFRVTRELFRHIRKVDVVTLHASISGMRFFAPIVMLVCWLHKKPWIFRGFGGNFVSWYQQSSIVVKLLFRFSVLMATRILLETRESVRYFSNCRTSAQVEWYPNSRPIGDAGSLDRKEHFNNRFLYLGHVQESKGILIIREAVKLLRGDISIDVYGPLCQGMTVDRFEIEGIRYCGVVNSSEVVGLIKKYSALVFPTIYEGEGYPGVVLEAFSAGVPVITTRFRAIPEIVDDSCGLLVAPGSSMELAEAIERLAGDHGLRQALADGARKRGAAFHSNVWSMHFVKICNDIVRSR